MALKDTRGGREFDKFVADGSGDTTIRTAASASVTTSTTSEDGEASTSSGFASGTGETIATGADTAMTAAFSVEGKERIGIQMFNTGDTATTQNSIFKVWGTLLTTPGSITGGNWTQIGDDIQVDKATSSYKAIATTPIKYIGVTARSRGAAYDGVSAAASTGNVYIMAD